MRDEARWAGIERGLRRDEQEEKEGRRQIAGLAFQTRHQVVRGLSAHPRGQVRRRGREPSHSDDAVALLTQQSASSTLKARPAKLHHAAANVDREDNHAPGSVSSAKLYA
jgi:hypothetical protein